MFKPCSLQSKDLPDPSWSRPLPQSPYILAEFLEQLGLEDRETLNPPIVKSGSCQFSSLADQLFFAGWPDDFRPDLHLRRLALYMIRANKVRSARTGR
jgi:hypothetical protein